MDDNLTVRFLAHHRTLRFLKSMPTSTLLEVPAPRDPSVQTTLNMNWNETSEAHDLYNVLLTQLHGE